MSICRGRVDVPHCDRHDRRQAHLISGVRRDEQASRRRYTKHGRTLQSSPSRRRWSHCANTRRINCRANQVSPLLRIRSMAADRLAATKCSSATDRMLRAQHSARSTHPLVDDEPMRCRRSGGARHSGDGEHRLQRELREVPQIRCRPLASTKFWTAQQRLRLSVRWGAARIIETPG